MKRITIGIVAAAALVFAASFFGGDSAKADFGPHIMGKSMTTDACAGCHRAHTAPAAYLLVATEEHLCESCHDGTGATTNVVDGQLSPTGAALRAGGFEHSKIDSQDQSWRMSKECTEPSVAPPPDAPVPGTGSPGVPCTDGDSTWGEAVRVSFCGMGAAMPATTADWLAAKAACALPSTKAAYESTGTWSLHIGVLPGLAANTSRHDLEAPGTIWGSGPKSATAFNGASGTLECTSCHDPHGNGQYRILRPNPATMVGLTGTFTGGVTVPDACPQTRASTAPFGLTGTTENASSCNAGNLHSYTTDNYMNATYVQFTTGVGPAAIACTSGSPVPGYPNVTCPSSNSFQPYQDGMWPTGTTEIGMSAWCSQCHQRYLGRSVYAQDSGDGVFKFRHSSEGTPAYNGRQCNTCHVAHGTNAAATGYANDGLSADSALLKMDNRGMCQKCHKN